MKLDKKITFLILGAACVLFAAGLWTSPSLGDEISHYRQAKSIFQANARVVTEPVYQKTHTAYFYNSEPFWHLGLAAVWRLSGSISFPIAQIYHTCYMALLLLAVYLFALELYEKKTAFLSVLLLASMPMMTAFGILFYTDVPVAALCMSGFLFLKKKKIVFAALSFSAAALTKASALFFLPAVIGLLLWNREEPLLKRIAQSTTVTTAVTGAAFWDFLWRKTHTLQAIQLLGGQDVTSDPPPQAALINRLLLKDWSLKLAEHSNTSLFNITDILKCFGIPFCILIIIYFYSKKENKVSAAIMFPLASYFFFFCYIFHPWADIRYLLPLAPFFAILAACAAVRFWSLPWFKGVLLAACLLQFSGSAVYVAAARRITPEVKQAFDFIKQTVPENELVIYPEYVLVEETERPMIWSYRFRDQLTRLFWDKDKKEILEFLTRGNVRYLAIKNDRIYDDSKQHHFGGYPKSFVTQLENSPAFKLLFRNKAVSVWYLL